MKKLSILTILLFCAATLFAQTVSVTFTGRDAQNQYLPLTRVVVSNLTKGWQETLYWPDTVLLMTDGTGIGDVETFPETSLRLSQNNPNPFDGTTFVNLQVAEPGDVAIEITDITGRIVGANNYSPLQPGIHEIRISLAAAGIYFLTARQNGRTASVKMVNRGNGGGNAVALSDIVGANNDSPLPQPKNAHRGETDNPFELGDQMEYVGFATQNATEVESGHVMQTQEASQTVVLTFGDGAPCSGTPTVIDIDGNVYNTVQIGQQCWTRENLRTTHYADGTAILVGNSNASYVEPYYYDYSTHSLPLETRGYLYNWPAAMHGSSSSSANPSGVQGLCPTGWHLPSDEEWSQLIDYVSGESEYTCSGIIGYIDIAKALASETGWYISINTCEVGNDPTSNNATGFSAVPAGSCYGSLFSNAGFYAHFWSSTQYDNIFSYNRSMYCNAEDVDKDYRNKDIGYSVRCLRD